MTEIYPIYDKMISRSDRELRLGQVGRVLWFTGLSGSGKSTLAVALENKLYQEGKSTMLLDGDNVRTGICNNLGFSIEDRTENIRRIAEVAKLFKENGQIVLCSFVSPTNDIRKMAKNIIGSEDFIEIFVSTDITECEKRDVKGLYQKARAGLIKDFSGIDSPFEPPINPDIIIDTTNISVDEGVETLISFLKK
ncbi:MAG: adenylyl-sulfate kinase [Saprospiraceae bacterium]|nr:adenylyl-sulfate kinase [Saprospiraceae bacterium]MBP7644118.1 adenylyl-sulfate kinase [Saprospiraceae bacterium]